MNSQKLLMNVQAHNTAMLGVFIGELQDKAKADFNDS
jgi:hypothetical protein